MSWAAELARKKAVNQARVASINAKYEAIQKNKQQIQNALKSINNPKKSTNHVCFDSDSDKEETKKILETKEKKGDLFLGLDSDDNNEDMTISVKEQFEGKKGQKLMQAQAKIGKDSRFQLDKRFQSDESDSESSSSDESGDEKNTNELAKNLAILNDVLGVKQHSSIGQTKKNPKFLDQTKLRYDPNQIESKALELSPKKSKPKKKAATVVEKNDNELKVVPGRFVEASYASLKETFDKSKENKTKNDTKSQPFSFASMFSTDNLEMENETEVSEERFPELIENKTNTKFQKLFQQPSKYSSSESEDEEMETETIKIQFAEEDEKPKSFFINSLSDPRIVKGLNFFASNKSHEEVLEDWKAVREVLTEEYKNKQRYAKRRIKND